MNFSGRSGQIGPRVALDLRAWCGRPWGRVCGRLFEADAEEKAKRVRRMDRFSRAAPAAATDTAGDEANL